MTEDYLIDIFEPVNTQQRMFLETFEIDLALTSLTPISNVVDLLAGNYSVTCDGDSISVILVSRDNVDRPNVNVVNVVNDLFLVKEKFITFESCATKFIAHDVQVKTISPKIQVVKKIMEFPVSNSDSEWYMLLEKTNIVEPFVYKTIVMATSFDREMLINMFK